jgi:hypothetical protein
MGETYVMYEGEEKCMQNFVGKTKEKILEDPEIYERIILK